MEWATIVTIINYRVCDLHCINGIMDTQISFEKATWKKSLHVLSINVANFPINICGHLLNNV